MENVKLILSFHHHWSVKNPLSMPHSIFIRTKSMHITAFKLTSTIQQSIFKICSKRLLISFYNVKIIFQTANLSWKASNLFLLKSNWNESIIWILHVKKNVMRHNIFTILIFNVNLSKLGVQFVHNYQIARDIIESFYTKYTMQKFIYLTNVNHIVELNFTFIIN